MKPSKIKPGDFFPTNDGGSVVVVEYQNASHVLVKHNDEHGHISDVHAGHLRNGKIRNPYLPSVYGIGFLGEMVKKSNLGERHAKSYSLWVSMLSRAYCKKFHSRYPSYNGVTVCEGWHNFQVFSEWANNQKNSSNKLFHLDKDLRVLGSKEYSPCTASFVPKEINTLLGDSKSARGKFSQGVSIVNGSWFRAQISINGERLRLGTYETPERAFQVYQAAKEAHVKSMAKKWKNSLHPEVFLSLINYKVKRH